MLELEFFKTLIFPINIYMFLWVCPFANPDYKL